MKILKFGLLLLAISILLPPVDSVSAATIKWYSYKEGTALGKKQGKKVFITFRADWCGWCRKMEKDTFQHPSVVSYLNDNFISIKVDTDKQKDLAIKYKVRGLPLNWFLSGDGESIGSRPGYLTPEMLMAILKSLHEPQNNKQ